MQAPASACSACCARKEGVQPPTDDSNAAYNYAASNIKVGGRAEDAREAAGTSLPTPREAAAREVRAPIPKMARAFRSSAFGSPIAKQARAFKEASSFPSTATDGTYHSPEGVECTYTPKCGPLGPWSYGTTCCRKGAAQELAEAKSTSPKACASELGERL